MPRRKSKWSEFAERKEYGLQDLGRSAIFLLPVKKLKKKAGKITIERALHKFLIKHFGAHTSSTIPSFGFWKDINRPTIADACRQYEVSFSGKERIPLLLAELARIAALAGEECIYCKAGQYSCLVYPPRRQC